MIAEVQEVEEESFKPITIRLKIESKRELQELWHRFNIGCSRLKKCYTESELRTYKYAFIPARTDALWKILNDKLKGEQ